MKHLSAVVNPALLITFSSYGPSTFLQCYSINVYSVLQYKRLFSGSGHAGEGSIATEIPPTPNTPPFSVPVGS